MADWEPTSKQSPMRCLYHRLTRSASPPLGFIFMLGGAPQAHEVSFAKSANEWGPRMFIDFQLGLRLHARNSR